MWFTKPHEVYENEFSMNNNTFAVVIFSVFTGNTHDSKYENIDQSVPSNNYIPVETASSPKGIDDPHVSP